MPDLRHTSATAASPKEGPARIRLPAIAVRSYSWSRRSSPTTMKPGRHPRRRVENDWAVERWSVERPPVVTISGERELMKRVLLRRPVPDGQRALFRALHRAGEAGAGLRNLQPDGPDRQRAGRAHACTTVCSVTRACRRARSGSVCCLATRNADRMALLADNLSFESCWRARSWHTSTC